VVLSEVFQIHTPARLPRASMMSFDDRLLKYHAGGKITAQSSPNCEPLFAFIVPGIGFETLLTE
jgi:hypothetical protein